jgi:hypothetical protein
VFRQGDVLIVPVGEAEVPGVALRSEPQRRDPHDCMVLALGESTGHAHAVVGRGALYPGATIADPAYLHLPYGGRVVHEEHGVIPLPEGWFRVVRQREYEPGAFRVVAD